jgi:hypothetical protein
VIDGNEKDDEKREPVSSILAHVNYLRHVKDGARLDYLV